MNNMNTFKDLDKRLSYLKKYDDKFKTCILPIMIAIVFGIVVAIAMAAISYQKASTVDVMYEAWEDASAKIPMTEENKDMYAEIYKSYQKNLEVDYLEPKLKKRRAEYIKSLKK